MKDLSGTRLQRTVMMSRTAKIPSHGWRTAITGLLTLVPLVAWSQVGTGFSRPDAIWLTGLVVCILPLMWAGTLADRRIRRAAWALFISFVVFLLVFLSSKPSDEELIAQGETLLVQVLKLQSELGRRPSAVEMQQKGLPFTWYGKWRYRTQGDHDWVLSIGDYDLDQFEISWSSVDRDWMINR